MNLEKVSKRLYRERQKQGLTQKQMAEKTGVAQSYISLTEKNGNAMSYAMAEKYAVALGYTISISLTDKKTGKVIE